MDLTVPPGRGAAFPERVPLGAAVVEERGLVSRLSAAAARLLGVERGQGTGRPAVDVLPVYGVLADHGLAGEDRAAAGPVLRRSAGNRRPAAGRVRSGGAAVDGVPLDVLWWAYPLTGAEPDRLLVLLADAAAVPAAAGTPLRHRYLLPGFGPSMRLSEAAGLAAGIAAALHAEPGYARRLAACVLRVGRPVLGAVPQPAVSAGWRRRRDAAALRAARAEAVRHAQAMPSAGAHG